MSGVYRPKPQRPPTQTPVFANASCSPPRVSRDETGAQRYAAVTSTDTKNDTPSPEHDFDRERMKILANDLNYTLPPHKSEKSQRYSYPSCNSRTVPERPSNPMFKELKHLDLSKKKYIRRLATTKQAPELRFNCCKKKYELESDNNEEVASPFYDREE